MKARIWSLLGALGWIVALAYVGSRLWPQIAAAAALGGVDTPAPELRLRTLAGDSVLPASLRGRVVLVNFWATWCPPCRVEMPGFERVWRSREARGFTIVGVADDAGGESKVRAFLAERGITYPVVMADGSLERAFGSPNVLPTSFLIDRRGRIRHVVRGLFVQPALASAVDRLLAESPAATVPAATARAVRSQQIADSPVKP